jgi:phage baseplate assembly protein W
MAIAQPATQVIWSDLDPSLTVSPNGQITILTNIDAVYASLNNIFTVVAGERIMMRTFAMNFLRLLFESLNNSALQQQVLTQFKNNVEIWEPRVQISNINVTSDQDYQVLTINMEFYILGYSQIFTLSHTFQSNSVVYA